jgi:hypothetical protein
MEAYDEEKTIFLFEDEEKELDFWIDKYIDDPIYEDEGERFDDPEVRLNALACGASHGAKDGSYSYMMFLPEIISTYDVIALRDGVHQFLSREIDAFGPFPKKCPLGSDYPFFQLTLKRNEDGSISYSVTIAPPPEFPTSLNGNMKEETVCELYAYFSRIACWFPPRVSLDELI